MVAAGKARPAASHRKSHLGAHVLENGPNKKIDSSAPASLGFGVGFRPTHYQYVLAADPAELKVDWFEVISENFMGVGGRPRRVLETLRARFPVGIHGVSMNLGGTAPFAAGYLQDLRELVKWIEPTIISDHLCWTSHGGRNSYDLLPLPYTREALNHVVRRISQVQEFLGRQILVENPSAYVLFAGNEYSEAEFLKELALKSGCGLLLDVNNIFVSCCNLGFRAEDYFTELATAEVRQFHLAGHSVHPDIRIDTHDDKVPPEVWALYRQALAQWPSAATLLEWDDKIPEFSGLVSELEKARVEARLVLAQKCGQEPVPHVGVWRNSVSELGVEAADVRDLPGTYQAFLRQMVSPDGVSEAALTPYSPSTSAPPQRGMEVYNFAYFTRLRDVLMELLPSFYFASGEDHFDQLVGDFLKGDFVSNYSINSVVTAFVQYLGKSSLLQELYPSCSGFLLELAQLEECVEVAFDLPDGPAGISESRFAAVSPEQWASMGISFSTGTSFLHFRHDILKLHDEIAAKPAALTNPIEVRQCIRVWREASGKVRFEEVTLGESALGACLAQGRPFEEAASVASLGAEQAISILLHWTAMGIVIDANAVQ